MGYGRTSRVSVLKQVFYRPGEVLRPLLQSSEPLSELPVRLTFNKIQPSSLIKRSGMKGRKPGGKVTTKRKKKLQMKNSDAPVLGPNEITEPEKLPAVNPTEVLLELVALLEDYAPTWYTKKQRDRAFTALRVLGIDLEE